MLYPLLFLYHLIIAYFILETVTGEIIDLKAFAEQFLLIYIPTFFATVLMWKYGKISAYAVGLAVLFYGFKNQLRMTLKDCFLSIGLYCVVIIVVHILNIYIPYILAYSVVTTVFVLWRYVLRRFFIR